MDGREDGWKVGFDARREVGGRYGCVSMPGVRDAQV